MRASLFSAKAEYACMAMLELANRRRDPAPIRLKTIADSHAIPKRFLVQILLQLKAAGLIASTRGAAGGYQLAREPENVSLGDIIGIIDRTDPVDNHLLDPRELTPAQRALRGVWNELAESQQRILERTSLADFAARAKPDAMMYSI